MKRAFGTNNGGSKSLSQLTATAAASVGSGNKQTLSKQPAALAKSSPGLLQEAELRQLELAARPKEQQNDLWYKACKKIAQLTKVIYFLNTQTEDTELQMQQDRSQHRDELIKIKNDREAEMKAYREAVDRIIAERKELIAKAEAQGNSEEATKQMRMEYLQASEEAKSRIISMETDLTKLNQQLQNMTVTMESQMSKAEQEITEMNQSHQRAIEELRKRHEEISFNAKEESKKVLDAYRKRLEVEQEMSQSLQNRLELLHDQHEQSMEAVRLQYRNRLKNTLRDVQKVTAVIQTTVYQPLQSTRQQIDSATEAASKLTEQMERLDGNLRQTQLVIGQCQTRLDETIEDFDGFNEELVQAYERGSRWMRRTKDMAGKLELKEQQLLDAKQLVEDVSRERDRVTGELKKEWQQNKELQEKMDRLQVYVDETNLMKRRYEKQMKELKKVHQEELAAKDEEIQNAAEQARQEMMEEHQLQLDQIDEQIEQTRLETEERIEAMQAEHLVALTKLKEEKQKLKDELVETSKRSTAKDAEIEKWMKDFKRMIDEKNRLQTVIDNQRNKLLQLEMDKVDMMQQLRDNETRVRAELSALFEKEKSAIDAEWHGKVASEIEVTRKQLYEEHQNEMSGITQKMEEKRRRALEKMQAEHDLQEQEWENIRDQLQKQLDASLMEVEFRKQEKRDLQQVNRVRQHRSAIRMAVDQARRRLQWQDRLAAALSQQAEIHRESVAELMAKHQDKLGSLSEDHRRELIAYDERSRVQTQALRDNDKELYLESMFRLSDEIEAEITAVRRACELKLMEFAERAEKERFAKEMKIIKDHDQQLQRKDQEMKVFQEVIKKLEKSETEKQMEIKSLDRKLTAANERITKLNQEADNLRAEMEQALEQRDEEHKQAMKQANEDAEKKHLLENQDMIEDFEGTKNRFKEKVSDLKQKLKEADLRYINREPRDVDLQTIAALRRDVERLTLKLAGQKSEIELMRNELMQREESLNRIFNARPQIGVLMPATKKSIGSRLNEHSVIPPPLENQLGATTTKLPNIRASSNPTLKSISSVNNIFP